MRDGEPKPEPKPEVKPEIENAKINGNAVVVKNNTVEVKYEGTEETLPEVTVNFKDVVKVQSIRDESGKEYTTAAQLEEAKAWLGYAGDLTKFTKTVNLTGTTRTFAEVVAKLGDSFQVTVVNEEGESLTLTINLALDVPAPVLVKDLGENLIVELLPGVLALKVSKDDVVVKFPKITEDDVLVLTIGLDTFDLTFKTDIDGNKFWSSQSIDSLEQEITKSMIENGVITIK